MPDPASMMMISSSFVLISRQVVSPPYFTYSSPETGIEPRAPQHLMIIDYAHSVPLFIFCFPEIFNLYTINTEKVSTAQFLLMGQLTDLQPASPPSMTTKACHPSRFKRLAAIIERRPLPQKINTVRSLRIRSA